MELVGLQSDIIVEVECDILAMGCRIDYCISCLGVCS